MQFGTDMEAVTISNLNPNQMPVSQSSPVPALQPGLLQPHVMAQSQVSLLWFHFFEILLKIG